MSEKQVVRAAGREVTVSSLRKVLFPATGYTKGQVIDYYVRVSGYLLPHLRDRPLTLKLFLNGINAPVQYIKNAPAHRPAWIRTAGIWRRSGESKIQYVLVNDLPTLIWAVNHYSLEMHVFLARVPEAQRPTTVVFDLDPGEHATILDCARVALFLQEELHALKLRSFVKASGSKGLHVVVPLNTDVTYEQTGTFAAHIARRAQEQLPELTVTEMARNSRTGKVFIDYSQNTDFKSTAAVYSLRAHPQGPFISVPLEWSEVAEYVNRGDAGAFLVEPDAALERVAGQGDLFAPVLKLRQKLPRELSSPLRRTGQRQTRTGVKARLRPELQRT